MRCTPLLLAAALAAANLPTALSAQAPAEKPPLTHDSYDIWNRITTSALSDDGQWLLYGQSSEEADPVVFVKSVRGATEHELARATGPSFTEDNRFVVFTIRPAKAVVDSLEAADTDDDDMPSDTLGILDLRSGQVVTRVPDLRSFRTPAEAGGWVAYHLEAADGQEDEEEEPDSAAAGERGERGERPEREPRAKRRTAGTELVLRNLDSGQERRIGDVTSYTFTEDGGRLVYTRTNEAGDADGVYVMATGSGDITTLKAGKGHYKQVTIAEDQRQVAFVSNADDFASELPLYTLYHWDGSAPTARAAVQPTGAGIPEGWAVADRASLRFSDNGERLFFGTAAAPEPEVEDSTPDDEKVELDVWNWKDPLLQPMQLVQAERERNRTYDAVLHIRDGRTVQLATQDMPDITLPNDGDGAVIIGRSSLPYRQAVSWDGTYYDIYTVDPATGERELILEEFGSSASISPDERYLYWWDELQLAWFARPLDGGAARNITAALPHPVHNELHDAPSEPGSYGMGGWTQGDARVLIYDRYDVWEVDPSGSAAPRNITEGVGRANDIRFRVTRLDREEDFLDPDAPLLLSAFHMLTKQDGFYRDRIRGDQRPARLIMEDVSFGNPSKADDADVLLITRSTFQDYPDLYITDPDFRAFERKSAANPQQAEYRWGSAETVEWNSVMGEPLQGILYKPEGFDPSQQYPMMVYFYERLSDGLHRHVTPSAGGSSINTAYYVSNGYLVFQPDIPYRIGYPGESAMNAVVPGVLSLLDEGFVDRDRIGVQGHSWGGYQIAYMVTKTDLFAAAEAGAPVVNMISAYGGIRWSSGMSRMFQYEKTQSRLGGTLWETPMRFIENSPIFWADKVNTPVLMLHNDEDGAVPWYQGIEYFTALRRLSKPVWMLNYNGEDHGLRQAQNRKDWTIRMAQFFDHYLKGAPPPVWMEYGIPATEKGVNMGLELVEGRPTIISEQGGRGGQSGGH
ncbi:MAG: prolyl oligopeptidase family serine peptidase [Gemmatimonadota bacterium]